MPVSYTGPKPQRGRESSEDQEAIGPIKAIGPQL